MVIYFRLLMLALIPVVFSVIFYLLIKKTNFASIGYKKQQIIIGVVFGMCAILGTEFGVDVNGATANARDAGPLCAGLLFGPQAGIIAGCIGGVERFFAAYWGKGMYSQLACSISTILAGFFGAFLRVKLFNNKRCSWGFGLAIGIIMEIVHMTILFLTHLDDAVGSFNVVRICTVPMVFANGVAVMLSCLLLTLLTKKLKRGTYIPLSKKIVQQVQVNLMVLVTIGYFVTTLFVYGIQSSICIYNAEKLLKINLEDVKNDINDNAEPIQEIVSNRHIGISGYILVVDENNNIISSSNNQKLNDIGLTLSNNEYRIELATISDVECSYMYINNNDSKIVAIMPNEEIYSSRTMMTYINSYMEVIVFASLFIAIYFLIKKKVVDNVNKTNASLGKIINGNLDVVLNIKGTMEFEYLSKYINMTVGKLKQYIQFEKERIDKELEIAKLIQHSALPLIGESIENNPHFEIAASMDTAKEVGGDFYDFYLKDNKLYFLVADVSGKGIPAAMLMMRGKSIIRSLLENGLPIKEVLEQANNKLCEGNDSNMFITCLLGELNLDTGELTLVNAGHNLPILINKDDSKFIKLNSGFVLGGIEDLKYTSYSFNMNKNDKIFFYTDGVTESINKKQELYGENRLIEFINSYKNKSNKELLNLLKKDLDAYSVGLNQFDDITMLCVEYKR